MHPLARLAGLLLLTGSPPATAATVVPVIASVQIFSGDEWPSVDVSEGVVLDDFVFSTVPEASGPSLLGSAAAALALGGAGRRLRQAGAAPPELSSPRDAPAPGPTRARRNAHGAQTAGSRCPPRVPRRAPKRGPPLRLRHAPCSPFPGDRRSFRG